MRIRRLELAIISITLAFVFFMGGYFTGRSHKHVSIAVTATQEGQTIAETPRTEPSAPTATSQAATSPQTADSQSAPPTPEYTEPSENPQETEQASVSDWRININTASIAELMDLPGIGNTLATRIYEYRVQYGNFRRIEDLRNVSGIGEKRFDAIKDLVTVG